MQQDFILRMIERIGVLFAAIRKLIIGGGDPSEVETRLAAAADAAGYDLGILRSLDLESLLAVVAPGGEVDISRLWMMGELLLLDGLQASRLEDSARATELLTKSRALFELLGTSNSVSRSFPEASERIAEIDLELEEIAGPSGG